MPAPAWQNSLANFRHIEVREVATRKLLWKSAPSQGYGALKFSSKSNYLVTDEEGKCVLRRTRDFRKVPLVDPGWDYASLSEMSSDERWLVGTNARQYALWDAHTGRLVRTFARRIGPTTAIYTLKFSPDGRLLASTDDSHTTCVWDLANGKLLRALHGIPKREAALAFAPQDFVLAIGDGDTITLWNWRTNAKLRTMTLKIPTLRTTSKWPYPYLTTLAWSPDGSLLVSGSGSGTLTRWRIK